MRIMKIGSTDIVARLTNAAPAPEWVSETIDSPKMGVSHHHNTTKKCIIVGPNKSMNECECVYGAKIKTILQTWGGAQVRICELLFGGNCKASCCSEGADQHRACTCSRILGFRSSGVWVDWERVQVHVNILTSKKPILMSWPRLNR